MPLKLPPQQPAVPGTIFNPYADLVGGRWLKGNIHAHTTHSDGTSTPQQVVDIYASKGHDFLMISDHDILTTAEDHAQLDPKGLILIPGNEISRSGPHMLHVGARELIYPHMPRQRVINEAVASGGFIVVAHPNWQGQFNHARIEQMQEWVDYLGMEIYNGAIGRLDGSSYALDKWDLLLSAGRQVWGFANDDSHHVQFNDYALGWNVAYVTDPTPQGVVAALQAGRFYASTGVTISSITLNDRTIRIESPDAQRIVAYHQIGKRFATVDSNVMEVTIPEHASYVRFECWGKGETFAWTQPIFHVPFPAAPKK